MKGVTLIYYLFLASFAESEPVIEREQELEGGFHTHPSCFGLSEKEFSDVIQALFGQNVQRATYEEVVKMTNDITELAKKCTADEQADPACRKPLDTVLSDKLCHEQGLGDKYGFTECCGKVDQERKECFLSHKNATIPPFQKPAAEEGCKTFHNNSAAFMDYYLHEIVRSNPSTSIFTLIIVANDFEKVLSTCCQEADKDSCFNEKAPPIRQQVIQAIAMGKYICSIQKTFGKRMVTALKFIHLSQKFPRANVSTLLKLAKDVAHIHEECCKGDTLECFIDRAKFSNYICSHQDAISSKVKGCCEKPVLKKGKCIMTLENDDMPADLSPTVREFLDNNLVCPRYAEDQNMLLAEFLFEYARRHPEWSAQLILRLGDGYEDLLEKCCKSETPKECFAHGEEEFKSQIANTLEELKSKCDLQRNLGGYFFQNALLLHYTKKAPQLQFEELYQYTKQLIDVASKCCDQDDAHRLRCAEKYTDVVLGTICQRHEELHINRQVSRCCSESYAFRSKCFAGLGVDEEYVPAPFDPELFTFHADLCSSNPEDQERNNQKLLVNLLKYKPTIADQQLVDLVTDFTGLVSKCCKADSHDNCFTAEGSILVEKIRAALGQN